MSGVTKYDPDVMEERLELFCATNEFTYCLEDITGDPLRLTSMKTTQVDGVVTFYEKVTEEKTPFGTRVITTKRECHWDGKEYFSLIKIDEPTKDGRKIASETRSFAAAWKPSRNHLSSSLSLSLKLVVATID